MIVSAGSYEQHAAVEAAEAWTAAQAERLGVSVDEVMAGILAGWTAAQVERIGAANAHELAEEPPKPQDLAAGINRIRNAPILPIRLDYPTKRRLREERR